MHEIRFNGMGMGGSEPFGISSCLEAFPSDILSLGNILHSIKIYQLFLLDFVYHINPDLAFVIRSSYAIVI